MKNSNAIKVSNPGTPTLDQLRVLVAVVDTGSFAGAARKLNRATSVISYAIANLEFQLGVQLFDRHATRKPVLSEAGRMVLAEARSAATVIDGLRAKVKGLKEGLEAEVHIAVDVMMPAWRLMDALKAFAAEYPTVALRLSVEALGAITQLVVDRHASIGISGPLEMTGAPVERIGVGHVMLVPVAAPYHPLAQGPNLSGAARDHVQLVLTDRSNLTDGQDFAVMGTRTWRLADLSAKHLLLKGGLGWGNMPISMIEDDLRFGTLVELDLPDGVKTPYALNAIFRTDSPPGPAARWLVEWFQSQKDRRDVGKVGDFPTNGSDIAT